MVNDVARAFFEAPAIRNVCVEIPKEDKTEADVRQGRPIKDEHVWNP